MSQAHRRLKTIGPSQTGRVSQGYNNNTPNNTPNHRRLTAGPVNETTAATTTTNTTAATTIPEEETYDADRCDFCSKARNINTMHYNYQQRSRIGGPDEMGWDVDMTTLRHPVNWMESMHRKHR